MLSEVMKEFISDLMVVIPTGILITGLFVGTVVKFDIHPIVDWLYEDEE